MLNHQLIKTDEEGRLRTTLAVPPALDFNGGTPVVDGLLALVYVDGEYFVNGLGYGAQQRLSAEQEITAAIGNPFLSSRGRLRSTTDSPQFWLYGLPFGADGSISIAPPEGAPVPNRAFGSAFSSAFG